MIKTSFDAYQTHQKREENGTENWKAENVFEYLEWQFRRYLRQVMREGKPGHLLLTKVELLKCITAPALFAHSYNEVNGSMEGYIGAPQSEFEQMTGVPLEKFEVLCFTKHGLLWCRYRGEFAYDKNAVDRWVASKGLLRRYKRYTEQDFYNLAESMNADLIIPQTWRSVASMDFAKSRELRMDVSSRAISSSPESLNMFKQRMIATGSSREKLDEAIRGNSFPADIQKNGRNGIENSTSAIADT